MIKFIKNKNKEKKYFKDLFKDKFNEAIPNISNEMSYKEFYSILINEIYKKYQIEISKSDEPMQYLEKEKIRLRAKIELLKSQDFNISFKYISALYSLLVPIFVSAVGFILISTRHLVDLAYQNKIEQLKSENITNIKEIYS